LAHDLKLVSKVAIKEFDPEAAVRFVDVDKMRTRFVQEAHITRQLSHPHIIAIYDFFKENNTCYIVMPYLPDTLEDRVECLTISQAIQVMEQICEGLAYAHEFHPDKNSPNVVVHCDIKTNNILFDHNQVKIADFGIAHVPQGKDTPDVTGMIPFNAGTVFYMPPEQLDGKGRDDPRIDVYALGALFYQMLARGRYYLDFDESGTDQAYYKNYLRIREDPPLLERLSGAPAPFISILRRALSKDPRDRYANAAEMLEAIREASELLLREEGAQMSVAPRATEMAELEKARKLYYSLKHTFQGDQTAVFEILGLYERAAGNSELRQIALNGIHHVTSLALSSDDDGETVWKAWRMLFLYYSRIRPWLAPREDERLVETLHTLEHKLTGLWSSDLAGWADVSEAQAVGFQVFVSGFMRKHSSDIFSQPYARFVNLAQTEWNRVQYERARPRGLQALLSSIRRALVARPVLYATVFVLMLSSCAASYVLTSVPPPPTPTPQTPSLAAPTWVTRTPVTPQTIVTTVAPSSPTPTNTPTTPTITRQPLTPTKSWSPVLVTPSSSATPSATPTEKVRGKGTTPP
jgi:hypothetical protein